MSDSKKIVFVTNIPSPYRVFYFDKIAERIGNLLTVIYCATTESNREWNIPDLNHAYIFLKTKKIRIGTKQFYFNPNIWKTLKSINPDVIITGGFHPTMLIAIAFCRFYHKKHFINTDGWALTEKKLGWFHKFIRKIIYKKTDGFLPISLKGKLNLMSYGVHENKIHIIPYIIDNNQYIKERSNEKSFDIMFSGQFIERKMPFFFCEIAIELQKIYPQLNVLLIGNGPLKEQILNCLSKNKIDFYYPGFIQQNQLASYYSKSKLLLFPTRSDGWGVVVNEALAAGIPVISCDNAGSAGDLLIHEFNGLILPLQTEMWVNKISLLLNDPIMYQKFVNNIDSHLIKFSDQYVITNFLNAINK